MQPKQIARDRGGYRRVAARRDRLAAGTAAAAARSPSDRPEESRRAGHVKAQRRAAAGQGREHGCRSSIHAQAHLEGVHLSAVVAGRDLDQGVLDLDVNDSGMKLSGRALLAAIPARLDGAMDFRAGPPTQVLQTITVSGQPDARQLAAAGLDVTSVIAGTLPLQATLTERRNGQGELAVTADATAAELTVPVIEWRKPRGIAAKASARVTLDHDRLTRHRCDSARRRRHDAAWQGGLHRRQDYLAHGGSAGAGTHRRTGHGAAAGRGGAGPIVATISGAIDRSVRAICSSARRRRRRRSRPTEPPPGPPYTIDAKFDRVLMAQDSTIAGHHIARRERWPRVPAASRRRAERCACAVPSGDRPGGGRAAAHRQRRRCRRAAARAGYRAHDAGRTALRAGQLTTIRARIGRCPAPPISRLSACERRRRWASCCRR